MTGENVVRGTWTLEEISPALAKRYLEHMARNRKLVWVRVERMARSFELGHYRLTHQGIAFNLEGELIDGQHRLSAVVESGCTLPFWVYRGESDMMTIDTNRTRSEVDVILISGQGGDATVGRLQREIATAKMMRTGMGKDGCFDRQETIDFMNQHIEAITFAVAGLSGQCRMAPVTAVVARAYYSADHVRLAEFQAVISDGMATAAADVAAIKFRNLIVEKRLQLCGYEGRAVIYKKCETALRAFLDRRNLVRIHETDAELFPIPGDADGS